MKNIITISLILTLIMSSFCQGQTQISYKKSEINFFDFVTRMDYLSTIAISVESKYDVNLPYYEFYMDNLKEGEGCLFAISKNIPEKWSIDALDSPFKNCAGNEKSSKKFYLNCAARNYFTTYKDSLNSIFNLYVFFIDKKFLEGPFKETSESGSGVYYNKKINSEVQVFMFKDNFWIEIDKVLLGNENIKSFGSDYLKKMTLNQIKGES